MFNYVSRKELASMKVGESRVLLEKDTVKNAGASVVSYALRAKIKVTTRRCFVFVPTTEETIKGVLVTRLED